MSPSINKNIPMLPEHLIPAHDMDEREAATRSPLCAGEIVDNPRDACPFSQSSEGIYVTRFVYRSIPT